jgi:hypothetical protein
MYAGRLNTRKRIDLLVLFALIALAAATSLYFRTTLFTSFILYLLVPALYLCWREKKNYLKIFLASIDLTILGIALDVIAEHNHAWEAPTLLPLLSFPLWGVMPLELVAWGFCVVLFTLIFYEHFLDDERYPALSKHFLLFLIVSVVVFCWVALVATLIPHALGVRYAYLVLFGSAELPLVWIVFRKPKLLYKIIWLGLFFFILNFVFELTGLSLNQWTFPGQYIGWVNVFGFTFPWEELVLWIALSAPIQVFYYEEFFDDGK